MNNQFDELSKGLAQAVTRRQALRRFGAGLAGAALAMLGIGKAQAQPKAHVLCVYHCGSLDRHYLYRSLCLTGTSTCPSTYPLLNCPLYSATEVHNCP